MQRYQIVSLVALATALTLPAQAQPACQSGFVWRNAFSGDTICVSVQRRDQVAGENARAAANREAGGGASGPNTCRQGFVWRVANPRDLVCVTPESRELVAQENANPHAHVAAAAPAAAAQTTEWSPWKRAEDSEFRYRFEFDPRKQGDVTAIVEIRNRVSQAWEGAARGVDCRSNVLGRGEKKFSLRPGQTTTVQYLTANCGSATQPFMKEPSIARDKSL